MKWLNEMITPLRLEERVLPDGNREFYYNKKLMLTKMRKPKDIYEYIFGVYQMAGGNSRIAEEFLKEEGIDVCYKTIRNVWKEAGYKIGKRGGCNRISDEEEQEIIATYRKTGSTNLTAERTGHFKSFIYDVLDRNKVQILRIKRNQHSFKEPLLCR